MSFATLNRLPLAELRAMARGELPDTITDMDFLETLAARRCVVVPPWILQTRGDGTFHKLVRVLYTVDGELDKARILLLVARKLQGSRGNRFGPRITF